MFGAGIPASWNRLGGTLGPGMVKGKRPVGELELDTCTEHVCVPNINNTTNRFYTIWLWLVLITLGSRMSFFDISRYSEPCHFKFCHGLNQTVKSEYQGYAGFWLRAGHRWNPPPEIEAAFSKPGGHRLTRPLPWNVWPSPLKGRHSIFLHSGVTQPTPPNK